MRLRTRLHRLEQSLGPGGCPACADRRGHIVFVTSQRQPDGSILPLDEEPSPCAECGQIPEQIIEIVKPVVGSPFAEDERSGSDTERQESKGR